MLLITLRKECLSKGISVLIAFLVSRFVFVVASFMTSQPYSNIYGLYNLMANLFGKKIQKKNLGMKELAAINDVFNSWSVVLLVQLVSNLDFGILKRVNFVSDKRIYDGLPKEL